MGRPKACAGGKGGHRRGAPPSCRTAQRPTSRWYSKPTAPRGVHVSDPLLNTKHPPFAVPPPTPPLPSLPPLKPSRRTRFHPFHTLPDTYPLPGRLLVSVSLWRVEFQAVTVDGDPPGAVLCASVALWFKSAVVVAAPLRQPFPPFLVLTCFSTESPKLTPSARATTSHLALRMKKML